ERVRHGEGTAQARAAGPSPHTPPPLSAKNVFFPFPEKISTPTLCRAVVFFFAASAVRMDTPLRGGVACTRTARRAASPARPGRRAGTRGGGGAGGRPPAGALGCRGAGGPVRHRGPVPDPARGGAPCPLTRRRHPAAATPPASWPASCVSPRAGSAAGLPAAS